MVVPEYHESIDACSLALRTKTFSVQSYPNKTVPTLQVYRQRRCHTASLLSLGPAKSSQNKSGGGIVLTLLRGITWDHSRGYVPLVALSQRFSETHPDIQIIWDKRSLKDFGDFSIRELAGKYDLLIIDHPWAGFAVTCDILVDFAQALPADFLAGQAKNSVGQSYASYRFDGRQIALPIDAAAPVACYRPDLFQASGEPVPASFEEVLALAAKGRVLPAGGATSVLMDFYMFCATLTDRMFTDWKIAGDDVMLQALDSLRSLFSACPREAFQYNPIDVLELLASRDEYWYSPFEFGYSNYSRAGYARHRIKAGNVVRYGGVPLRTTLGGAGIAVSSLSAAGAAAVEFAGYAVSPNIQATLYAQNGGQPGNRAAWTDPEANRISWDFFSDTLATLDNAYLRPRYSGYPYFQDRAGAVLQEYLKNGGRDRSVLDALTDLYRESLTRRDG